MGPLYNTNRKEGRNGGRERQEGIDQGRKRKKNIEGKKKTIYAKQNAMTS